MRDVRRLTELSMPGELAKEVVKQIGAGSTDAIQALADRVQALEDAAE